MPLSWNEIRNRAHEFSKRWEHETSEDAEAKPFWIEFLNVFGIDRKRVASFEEPVKKLGDKQGYIDLFWKGMLLVEHKSRGKDLDKAYTQALDYFPGIKERDLPKYVLVSDFSRFRLYDLEEGTQQEFKLADLHKRIKHFAFIAGYRTQTIAPQNPVNIKAAERMGKLHDALKAAGYAGHPLEVLLVRLLFCLFAEDTGIFQPASAFRAWVEERTAPDGSDLGPQLAQLFQVLNTPENKRSKNLDELLAAFPYVNGKLFEEMLPIADFDLAMREALLDCCALDWSAISPAIFGALFQSIMDARARRNLGAHYTSEENILKLIGPLFLDALWEEFNRIRGNRNKLFEFHKKLRSLTFFDPACGCGNFLVIAYRELRKLELDVLRAVHEGPGSRFLDIHQQISVDVDQFFGIEIEEFPAQIAQVALWLMDHQMNVRVSEEFGMYFARIPLKTSPHIVNGNALALDWNDVLPAERASYVMGNPPFVGAKFMDDAQREDAQRVFADIKSGGLLDFVAAWYVKAARYMQIPLNPPFSKGEAGLVPHFEKGGLGGICAAFVSTNSITQGEQAGVLWGWLLAQGIHIHFAHRTFQWSNEAKGMAAVHCVIIGFGAQDAEKKTIYEYEDIRGEAHAVAVRNINPYLVDAPDVIAEGRTIALCPVKPIVNGSIPADGGNLILEPHERDELLAAEPNAAQWIRRYLGAEGFINGIMRYCLWLKDCPPSTLRQMPLVMARVKAVQTMREASEKAATREKSKTPTRFTEDRQPESGIYLALPRTSSENRAYIPIGYLSSEVIAANDLQMVPEAGVYEFGVLTSAMHMAWMRITSGRLKSDIRYSVKYTYNTFPWPEISDMQRQKTEAAAQAVLDARAQFPQSSLADLYDPLTMPPALTKAHQTLDRAVDACYRKAAFASDAQRVEFLFERYQQLTSLLPADKPARTKKEKAATMSKEPGAPTTVTPALPADYADWLKQLKTDISRAQQRAALSVNAELVQLYGRIGRDILQRQEAQGWGAKVIGRLAHDLKDAFPDMRGWSSSNLKYMRFFAQHCPDGKFGQQPADQLPWFHIVILLTKLDHASDRKWYATQAMQQGWSRTTLELNIKNRLHQRSGVAVTNFEARLPSPDSALAHDTLKDPYLFDFLGLGDDAHEREIEAGLIRHITRFLLELGAGFAFVGRQFRLEVAGDEFFIDLLFYHTRLKCYVVVELKATAFKPEHAGQLNFYLATVDAQIKAEDDKPTIGLLLCKKQNRLVAEYALSGIEKPIGVAEYQLLRDLPETLGQSLPSIEEIEAELAGDLSDLNEPR